MCRLEKEEPKAEGPGGPGPLPPLVAWPVPPAAAAPHDSTEPPDDIPSAGHVPSAPEHLTGGHLHPKWW